MAKVNPCEACDAKCCRYFALEIDKPKRRGDFEDIRWYLCHEAVEVFVDDGKWFLEVRNRCRHLDESHRCRIYADRPRLCREHSPEDCEGRSGAGFEHDLVFRDDAEFARFAEAELARRKAKKRKKKQKKQH